MGENFELKLKINFEFEKKIEKEEIVETTRNELVGRTIVKKNVKEKRKKTVKVKDSLTLEDGIELVMYDGKLNIVIINGIINENNVEILNRINEITEKTTQNYDIINDKIANNYDLSEIKFVLRIEENNHKEASLVMDQSRIIMYNEVYHKGVNIENNKEEIATSFNIVIRGYNLIKMPQKYSGFMDRAIRAKDYILTGFGIASGLGEIFAGVTGEVASFGTATPVAGVVTVIGIAQTTQSVSAFSSMINEDFVMDAGIGYGDEGDFMKSGFEGLFGENGGEVYEDVFFCLNIYSIGKTTKGFLKENIKYDVVSNGESISKKVNLKKTTSSYLGNVYKNNWHQNAIGTLENASYGDSVYSSFSTVNEHINKKKEK